MGTAFPGALDTTTEFPALTVGNCADSSDHDYTGPLKNQISGHWHINVSEATLALEEKVGITASAVVDTLEFRNRAVGALKVKNSTGGTLTAGTLIYLSGDDSGTPTITAGDPTNIQTCPTHILLEELENGETGWAGRTANVSMDTAAVGADRRIYAAAAGAMALTGAGVKCVVGTAYTVDASGLVYVQLPGDILDGAGLDADTLDGYDSAAFARLAAAQTFSDENTFSHADGVKLTGGDPTKAGGLGVNADLFKWFGTGVHTAVDLDTAQTITGSKTFSGANALKVPAAAPTADGAIGIDSAAFKWQASSVVHTGVDLDTAQTITGSKTYSGANALKIPNAAPTADTAVGLDGTDFKWQASSAVYTALKSSHLTDYDHTKIHDQNTDTGTTSATFAVDSGGTGFKLKDSSGACQIRNLGDSAFADLQPLSVTLYTGATKEGTIFSGADYLKMDADTGVAILDGQTSSSLQLGGTTEWKVYSDALEPYATDSEDIGDGTHEVKNLYMHRNMLFHADVHDAGDNLYFAPRIFVKTTTGDPGTARKGDLTINETDKTISIYAGGAWVQIGSWS